MIFKDSRYATVGQYTITDAAGRTHRALKMRIVPPTPAVFEHVVTDTDRLDLLAFKYYGKADRFWRVCDANLVMHPDDLLQAARRVRIPPDRQR